MQTNIPSNTIPRKNKRTKKTRLKNFGLILETSSLYKPPQTSGIMNSMRLKFVPGTPLTYCSDWLHHRFGQFTSAKMKIDLNIYPEMLWGNTNASFNLRSYLQLVEMDVWKLLPIEFQNEPALRRYFDFKMFEKKFGALW